MKAVEAAKDYLIFEYFGCDDDARETIVRETIVCDVN